jgi:hypothetical protein
MRTTIVIAALLCLPLSAAAQELPRLDTSVAYSVVRPGEGAPLLHGWTTGVTGHVTHWFGITGEVTGNYTRLGVGNTSVHLGIHSFLAGPRVTLQRSQTVAPYGHLLVGPIRARMSAMGESESFTEFAYHSGAGVDVRLRPRLGLRLGADYLRTAGESGGALAVRAGIVFAGR